MRELKHILAYQELHRKVDDVGPYKTGYVAPYGPDVVRCILLAVLSALCYRQSSFLTSALFLGLFWHQLTLCAHDFGRLAVTRARTLVSSSRTCSAGPAPAGGSTTTTSTT